MDNEKTPASEPVTPPAAADKPMADAPGQQPMKTDDSYSKPAGGYGQKGGWKKWALIYLVIAVVVYGVIYYFIKHNGASTGTGSLGY